MIKKQEFFSKNQGFVIVSLNALELHDGVAQLIVNRPKLTLPVIRFKLLIAPASPEDRHTRQIEKYFVHFAKRKRKLQRKLSKIDFSAA